MKKLDLLEKTSFKITSFIGTPVSIILHSAFFVGIFFLQVIGFSIDKILLILTTAVSLEAIYLSIFIQMTVNRHTESLEELEEDVEDISEDIEDIQEDEKDELKKVASLDDIENGLQHLIQDVEALKARNPKLHTSTKLH